MAGFTYNDELSEEECFMYKYGIISIIYPKKCHIIDFVNFISNKNMVMLVIEDMCLGLLLPYQIARRFSYIVNAINYDEHETYVNNGMKIIKISSDWDTRKWSYIKISKFYETLHLFENKTVDKIKEDNEEVHRVDLNFLESLLWNTFLELD